MNTNCFILTPGEPVRVHGDYHPPRAGRAAGLGPGRGAGGVHDLLHPHPGRTVSVAASVSSTTPPRRSGRPRPTCGAPSPTGGPRPPARGGVVELTEAATLTVRPESG